MLEILKRPLWLFSLLDLVSGLFQQRPFLINGATMAFVGALKSCVHPTMGFLAVF